MRNRRLTIFILTLLAFGLALQQPAAAGDAAADDADRDPDHDSDPNDDSDSPWLPLGIGAGGIAIVGLLFLPSR